MCRYGQRQGDRLASPFLTDRLSCNPSGCPPTSPSTPRTDPVPAACQLHHGPYVAPALAVGSQVTCLYRGCRVKVTGWTDAPIPWPRGRVSHGRPSLIVTDEFVRVPRSAPSAA